MITAPYNLVSAEMLSAASIPIIRPTLVIREARIVAQLSNLHVLRNEGAIVTLLKLTDKLL